MKSTEVVGGESAMFTPNKTHSNPLKRRSISLTAGVSLVHPELEKLDRPPLVKRQVSTDGCGLSIYDDRETSPSTNVSTIVLSKLRSFGRQLHRHMVETVNVTNDASRGLPRSAVGDLFFQNVVSTDMPIRKQPRQSRAAKLSLDLEITRNYSRVFELTQNPKDASHMSSFSRGLASTPPQGLENARFFDVPLKSGGSNEGCLSRSVPQLETLEHGPLTKHEKKQSVVVQSDCKNRSELPQSSPSRTSMNFKAHKPREVSYDDQGQTWEIYGADQDPNALGQAIESHLEKMMQRKQRGQRCLSLGNEISRQTACSTKSSLRASHAGDQAFQLARKKFRRRAVSTVTSTSANTTSEDSSEREPRNRRSRLLNYINRILRRSSTSALSTKRQALPHQDSLVEFAEPSVAVDKAVVSPT